MTAILKLKYIVTTTITRIEKIKEKSIEVKFAFAANLRGLFLINKSSNFPVLITANKESMLTIVVKLPILSESKIFVIIDKPIKEAAIPIMFINIKYKECLLNIIYILLLNYIIKILSPKLRMIFTPIEPSLY